jgi:acetyl-CoA carboxylase biotin carboxyl carrier protein
MARTNPFDPELVRELAGLLAETDLTEIEVEKGDLRIRVARQVTQNVMVPSQHYASAAPAPAAVAPAPVATEVTQVVMNPREHPGAVASPMVGTAYRRSSPDSKPFVEIGSRVEIGDKLLLVEAMKTFNDIVATRSGVVTAIFFEDGQPVEYGEPLLIVE